MITISKGDQFIGLIDTMIPVYLEVFFSPLYVCVCSALLYIYSESPVVGLQHE